ncbi:DUF1802 family protein [Singulisphaera sp. PoT]|uniref:DUF1802 family protein n=1 Tax=Singulisphaera sp. PoT TaxID=3411797 RepID=UPI003BF52CE2
MTAYTADSPETGACDVAFKEWAGVCKALHSGNQIFILRKGGIAEEQGEFVPEHRRFWLYPTYVHEAEQGLLTPARKAKAESRPTDSVVIKSFADVKHVGYIASEADLDSLEGLHVWKPETLLKRFQYRKPGLWVLVVRMFARREPVEVAVTPEQLGCKTWVPLEEPIAAEGLIPILGDAEFDARLSHLRSILSAAR